MFASEDARREGYPATIGAGAIVLVLYWLTSLYTHTLGIRLGSHERLGRRLFWRSAAHELAVVEGALVPVLALLVAWAAGASVAAGVTAAVGTTAACIVALEVTAGWRARLAPQALWLEAGVGAVMGLAIIGLKIVLH